MRRVHRLIVLDTCILARDYWLRGATFRTLQDLLGVFEAQILLPETVLAETVATFRSTLADTLRKSRRLDYLLDQVLIGNIDLDLIVGRYESYLHQLFWRLSQEDPGPALFERLPTPEIEHDQVVERLISGRRPFHGEPNKDRGYRDFLIWQSVVELATHSGKQTIIFVSDNVADFSESAMAKSNLHPDLLADLPKDSSVSYYTSLPTLLNDLMSSLQGKPQAFLRSHPDLLPRLAEIVPTLLNRWLATVATPRSTRGRTFLLVDPTDTPFELREITVRSNGSAVMLVYVAWSPIWTTPDDPEPIQQNITTVAMTIELDEDLSLRSADVDGDPIDPPPNPSLQATSPGHSPG